MLTTNENEVWKGATLAGSIVYGDDLETLVFQAEDSALLTPSELREIATLVENHVVPEKYRL